MPVECMHPEKFKTVSKADAITVIGGKILWHIDEKYITKDMDKFKIILAFEKAFASWQPFFSPIEFESTSNKHIAPIVIRFMSNGNPKLPSPFSSNTLAYAYMPRKGSLGIQSDMYFNDGIAWAEMHSGRRTNLFKVAVHELGHAFGIYHTRDIVDIMYPQYQPNNDVNITADTRNAIQFLYKSQVKPIRLSVKKRLTSWSESAVLKRVLGSLVRKSITVLSGALLASNVPIFISLGAWVVENSSGIQTATVAGILLLLSVVWSFIQKKRDVETIKSLEFRR